MSTVKKVTVIAKIKNDRVANKEGNKAPRKEPKPAVYLAEGVTGKQFNQSKLDLNSNHKKIQGSISQCIKNCQTSDTESIGYFASLKLSKTQLTKLLKPAKLIRHASNYRLIQYFNSIMNEKRQYIKFNVYEVLGMIKAELDGRDLKDNAVLFFDAKDSGDTEGMTVAVINAIKEVLVGRKDDEVKSEDTVRLETLLAELS